MKFSNTQAERWVLGGIMNADGPVLRATTKQVVDALALVPEDFTNAILRAAFGICAAFASQGRSAQPEAIWPVLMAELGPKGEADFQALVSQNSINLASLETLQSHAEVLRKLTRLRKLEAFHRAQLKSLEVTSPDPLALAHGLEAFTSEFVANTETDETGETDLHEVLEQWDAAVRGERLPYVQTGISVLDQVCRGFVANLNVVGGLPSVGKSALIGTAVMNCLERGETVGLFGLEDATAWLTKRHIARRMGMPVGEVGAVRLSEHDQERLSDAASALYEPLRRLLVYRRAGITPELLLQKARHWILNHKAKLVVIDHGGEVQHQGSQARDRYDLAVANTYRGLRDLAVNSRVPIVVLCHFNRDADNGGKPSRSSFAETAYIERMARLALGLWERDDEPDSLRVTILKRTDGPRDITMWLPRDREAGLIQSTGGGVLDLGEEAQERDAARRGAKWRSS